MIPLLLIFVSLLILSAFVPSPSDKRARFYMSKIEKIVGGRVTGSSTVTIHGKTSNAEEMLDTVRRMRKELQLLKREVHLRCDTIKAKFKARNNRAPGSAFLEGVGIGVFGWRTSYRVRGRMREQNRASQHDALVPLEKVIWTIDALVLQLDNGAYKIGAVIEDRDVNQPPIPTVPMSTASPQVIKLRGTIKWRYADQSSEAFPVIRALLHAPGVLSIDCDCGTAREPYVYTIHTSSEDGQHFDGRFSAGRSTPPDSEGRVSGLFQSSSSGYKLTGVWVEKSEESEWIGELEPVEHFADEVTGC